MGHAPGGAVRGRRHRITALFTNSDRFLKHVRPDEQLDLLREERQDPSFLRFDQAVGITDNLHGEEYTTVYSHLQRGEQPHPTVNYATVRP